MASSLIAVLNLSFLQKPCRVEEKQLAQDTEWSQDQWQASLLSLCGCAKEDCDEFQEDID
jgi:hypothetical protein